MTRHGSRAVVVGVDGSASSTRAVRWAARQAALWDCPLRLVHAHSWPWIREPELPGLPGDYRQALLNAAYDWLRAAADVAAETAPEVEVTTELVVSTPGPLLIEESTHARLVVLGSRGLGGFTGMLIGSTAVALAAHGRCPVAVIRGEREEHPSRTEPVVLGVDGTGASEAATAFAFEAAALRGAPLVAVHTWSDVPFPPPFVPVPSTYDWRALESAERTVLAERLAGWQAKYPDVPVEHVVTEGGPAASLLQAAKGAQLVVVGSRGRGGVRGLLLGSTSQALLHHAPCAVVVARPDTRLGTEAPHQRGD